MRTSFLSQSDGVRADEDLVNEVDGGRAMLSGDRQRQIHAHGHHGLVEPRRYQMAEESMHSREAMRNQKEHSSEEGKQA